MTKILEVENILRDCILKPMTKAMESTSLDLSYNGGALDTPSTSTSSQNLDVSSMTMFTNSREAYKFVQSLDNIENI